MCWRAKPAATSIKQLASYIIEYSGNSLLYKIAKTFSSFYSLLNNCAVLKKSNKMNKHNKVDRPLSLRAIRTIANNLCQSTILLCRVWHIYDRLKIILVKNICQGNWHAYIAGNNYILLRCCDWNNEQMFYFAVGNY